MSRRALSFLVVALLAAGTFTRLGFWQLGRLQERQATNAAVAARRDLPPVGLDEALRDSAMRRLRAVRFSGTWDYAREVVWVTRSRRGAPGVHFLTPITPDGGGPAVFVNRGWAYAADGMTVNDTLWREGPRGEVQGYVEEFPAGQGPVRLGRGSGVRRLDRDSLAAGLPYPIAPVMVVQQAGNGIQEVIEHPLRVDPPALDEGSHRGYALQWFAFAGITLLGSLAVVLRERGRASGGAPPRG